MNRTIFSAMLIAILCITIYSAEPSIWSVNTRADVLKGNARGVSIDHNGNITLAPRWSEVFRSDQSYIWSTAVDRAGNIYIGTGGDGKVFKVDPSGRGALFADLAEMNVTSVAIGRNDEVFAATSPDGKVYRLDAAGNATVFFTPNDKYIWSLASLPDGSIAVGTGDGGRIYKVRAAGADPTASLLFDTSETHIISLVTDRQGNLYAGTDSNGLVMRFGADGKPFGLLDSPLREIHEMAVGPDGSLYVLALGESASAPKPAEAAAAAPTAAETPTVSVEKPTVATPEAAKSKYDLTGAKTAVYRILPDGRTDILWTSTTIVGFSIYAHQTGNGVLVGTSDKGRIYSIGNDGRETLALQSDASQISTIRAAGNSLLATSSNPGVLYRFGPETVAEGSYESSVLDAKTTATWGRLWFNGIGNLTIQTRAGNTGKPDETWSSWSAPINDAKGAQVTSPRARYLQWRAVLRSSGVPARLGEVNVAFLPANIAPEVLSIQVLPTNVGLAANPPVQIDPNIELTGLDPAVFGIPSVAVPPRRVFQRGATSLQWTSEDRNGDKLVFDVFYREVGESQFKLLRGGLTDSFIAIDGQSLADGRYIFRVVAKDSPSNPAELALSGEMQTEPIHIDNTPPVVTVISGNSSQVVFEAVDQASYITRAEYSINAGEWMPIYSDDGIADSSTERFTVRLPGSAGEYSVTLRAYDVNGNSGNARRIVRK
jgi:sugar lactone lactonase YvrE